MSKLKWDNVCCGEETVAAIKVGYSKDPRKTFDDGKGNFKNSTNLGAIAEEEVAEFGHALDESGEREESEIAPGCMGGVNSDKQEVNGEGWGGGKDRSMVMGMFSLV